MSGHCFLTAIKCHGDVESTTVFCRAHCLPLDSAACLQALLALVLGTTPAAGPWLLCFSGGPGAPRATLSSVQSVGEGLFAVLCYRLSTGNKT